MADCGNSNIPSEDDVAMQQLREIILGKNQELVKQVIKDNAREMVSEVVIEAIHDRQKHNDEFSKILTPVVQKSVETSVKQQSEQFVGYFYPLVGRLVRKSVTSFLSEFLEKTNVLIENSLTFKGIKWRFKAWQSGVSFSQYVASQTFIFKVEQVLLIHQETGILLNSASQSVHESADGDLVSAMLTAINDFVSDSFNPQQESPEQNLEVIKTEDFSLVIKRGPKLLLVAAVTGNIPQDISTKFQITNEYIHKLYAKEIANFNGDTVPFEATSQQLQECLLAKMRPEAIKKKNKKPILAILLVLILCIGLGFLGFHDYQQNQLVNQITQIGQQPGIVLGKAERVGWQGIELSVLRDPDAISVEDWLLEQEMDASNILVFEKHYLSLEEPLVKTRLKTILARYPQVNVDWQQRIPVLQGVLPNAQRVALATEIYAIPGLTYSNELISGVKAEELATINEDSPEILTALFEINTAKIDSTQIEFEQGQSTLNEKAQEQLRALAGYLSSAIELSKKLELNVGLIIMGASDSTGSKQFNQSLSRKRAIAARQYLVEQGIEPQYLNAIGLGVVEMKASGSGLRKVIFNIIDFKTD
ncbi:OmpA family protein [Aliiglaciecola sp. 3_MG-2023]|uniref:OmpA family protein n=1 Tax=Aliiglaciecola sp. 3_MG-2023 TaxID=3062644 RepID=UPI0026E1E85F|nr:OmpA family protein [Aliiglaciecola sp. 3_MG-2023]MDO6694884.1 OmpA family protein [Aliiglaciecola sp. 3_MG-2023]